MTIQEFLTARLDEAEATTRRQDERWYVCNDGHVATPTAQEVDGTDHLPNHHNTWDVMYDPERVRADITSKRLVIGFHSGPANWCGWALNLSDHGDQECDTLRALASAYSDHEDYREEWRL